MFRAVYIKYLILLVALSAGITTAMAYGTDTVRDIDINLNNVTGRNLETFNNCVGAGRASEGLRADWQQQLTLVQKEIGFKYIRFHGLLNDDMHVYTEDANGNAIYNWQNVDKLYDFLLSIHIRPFVELGFMPPVLASGDQTVFWWKGNITPPKSYEKWAALITALMRHFEARYGRKEVEQWYFEVWNEPNLKEFFTGDMHEYFKLYETTARAIKRVSPTYRVGGPATSGSTWIKESLAYFATIPQLVDFISTHAYGTKSVFDEYGKRRTQMREPDGIPIAVRKLRADVDNSPFRGKPIFITEWNSSPNPRDPLHDTYQNATYLLNTLRKTEHLVNGMSYWTFTDIFEEAAPPVTSFHGGFGLLNLQGIKKPSYMAYKFLNELGNNELMRTDSSSWICKDNAGNLQVLIWDYKLLSPDTSYNQQFYSRVMPQVNTGKVQIKINNLHSGRYKLAIYHIGYHHNDPYTLWIEMGSPANISLKQEAQLKLLAGGNPDNEKIININNGHWRQDMPIDQNEVIFLKFTRVIKGNER